MGHDMSNVVHITIPGKPIPQARPRGVKNKTGRKGTQFYTLKSTRVYEENIAKIAGLVMRGKPKLTGPLFVNATFVTGIPSSWTLAKKALAISGELRPTSRPDLDNLFKSIDGLNKIVFKDDSQIVDVHMTKVYGVDPCTEYIITQLTSCN